MLKCFTHIRRAFINLKAAKADLPLFVEKCKYTKLYYIPEHPGVLVTIYNIFFVSLESKYCCELVLNVGI